ncbi:MAG TPA: pyruvate ferredoxin oxidoreductase [Spirochaetaceae bacterium]|nr:pyruvate ferredoxin oxidoreductase [Spirochaetaceae bacterium]
MKSDLNIYMSGVGGQGIGLLAELLARACDYAGLTPRGCDTHGLAQRGGMVTSHLRLGAAHSALVPEGEADLVVSLERTEALRAADAMLREGGSLVWYDACWQALDVRRGENLPVRAEQVLAAAVLRKASAFKVLRDDLPDSRMQNVAVVAEILKRGIVPGLERGHVEAAMADLMSGSTLEANIALVRA